jgi:hypothetical protein
VIDHQVIEIFSSKMGVSVGTLDLKDSLLDLKDRYIKSSSSEIVDGDNLVSLLVQAIGKSGGSRLINNTQDVKSRDLTGILGGLTLCVVEVCRDSDD